MIFLSEALKDIYHKSQSSAQICKDLENLINKNIASISHSQRRIREPAIKKTRTEGDKLVAAWQINQARHIPDPQTQEQLEEERRKREKAEADVADLTQKLDGAYEQIRQAEREKEERIQELRASIEALRREIAELRQKPLGEHAGDEEVNLERLGKIAQLEQELQNQQDEVENLVNPTYAGPAAGLMSQEGAGAGLPYDYSENMLRILHRPMRYLTQQAADFPLTVSTIKDGYEVNRILEEYKDVVKEVEGDQALTMVKRGPISQDDPLPLKAYLTKPLDVSEEDLEQAKDILRERLEAMRGIFEQIKNAQAEYEKIVKQIFADEDPGFLSLGNIFSETTSMDGVLQRLDSALVHMNHNALVLLLDDIEILKRELQQYTEGIKVESFAFLQDEWLKEWEEDSGPELMAREVKLKGEWPIFEKLFNKEVHDRLIDALRTLFTGLIQLSSDWDTKLSEKLQNKHTTWVGAIQEVEKAVNGGVGHPAATQKLYLLDLFKRRDVVELFSKVTSEFGRVVNGMVAQDGRVETSMSKMNDALNVLAQKVNYQAFQQTGTPEFKKSMEQDRRHREYMTTLSKQYVSLIVRIKGSLTQGLPALYRLAPAPGKLVEFVSSADSGENVQGVLGDVYAHQSLYRKLSFLDQHVQVLLPDTGITQEEIQNLKESSPFDVFNLGNENKESKRHISEDPKFMENFSVAVEKEDLIQKAKEAYWKFLDAIRGSEVLSVSELASILGKNPKTLGALLQYARIYAQYLSGELLSQDDITKLTSTETSEGWLLELDAQKRKTIEEFLRELDETSHNPEEEQQDSHWAERKRDQYLVVGSLVLEKDSEQQSKERLERFKRLLNLYNLYQQAQNAIRRVNFIGGEEPLDGFQVSDLLASSQGGGVPSPPPPPLLSSGVPQAPGGSGAPIPPPPPPPPSSPSRAASAQPSMKDATISLGAHMALYGEIVEGLNQNNWVEIVSKEESVLRATLGLEAPIGEPKRTKTNVEKILNWRNSGLISRFFQEGLLLQTIIHEALFRHVLKGIERVHEVQSGFYENLWRDFDFAQYSMLYFHNNHYPSYQDIKKYILEKLNNQKLREHIKSQLKLNNHIKEQLRDELRANNLQGQPEDLAVEKLLQAMKDGVNKGYDELLQKVNIMRQKDEVQQQDGRLILHLSQSLGNMSQRVRSLSEQVTQGLETLDSLKKLDETKQELGLSAETAPKARSTQPRPDSQLNDREKLMQEIEQRRKTEE